MMECIKYISLKEKEQMCFNFQSKDSIFKSVAYCLDTLFEVDFSVVEVSIVTDRQCCPGLRLLLHFGPLQQATT